MTYKPRILKKVSTNNSTTSTLTGGATFTGTSDDVSDYSSISVSYNADVASASDGLKMQFSPDGTNWDRTIPVTPEGNNLQTAFGGVHMLSVINQFFRITYENGSGAQSNFRLQVIYHTERSLPLVSRSDQVLNKHNDVALSRVVGDFNLDKARGLFGYISNTTIYGTKEDVDGTEQTIWRQSGSTSYVFPQAAETVRVKSGGNAADTSAGAGARTVTVTGLDENWAAQTETLTLAGSSASAATTVTFIRVNGLEVATVGTYGGNNTGTITLENTSTNLVLAVVAPLRGFADQAIYSVPAGKTMYITRFLFNVGDSNKSTIRAYTRQNADDVSVPFSPSLLYSQFNEFKGIDSTMPQTLRAIPEKSDFYMTAEKISGGGTSLVAAVADFLLVDDAS